MKRIIGLLLENGHSPEVGLTWRGKGVTEIRNISKNGQMAEVDWFAIISDGALLSEINGAYVVEIDYELPD